MTLWEAGSSHYSKFEALKQNKDARYLSNSKLKWTNTGNPPGYMYVCVDSVSF